MYVCIYKYIYIHSSPSFSLSTGWPLCLSLTPSRNYLTLFFVLCSPHLFCICVLYYQGWIGNSHANMSWSLYGHTHMHIRTYGQPTTIHMYTPACTYIQTCIYIQIYILLYKAKPVYNVPPAHACKSYYKWPLAWKTHDAANPLCFW